jgi:hypothetical protein
VKKRDCLDNISVEALKKSLCGSGYEQMAVSFEHSNKPLGSVKFREFLD